MADDKKYYYMRLKENFFDDDAMQILESMPDGYLYSNILLKLYLKSLKYNGKLMFNDRIPYNAQVLATITRHQVGTVEKALEIFINLGLIEVLDNGAIYMLDIQNYIGKSSTEADRKRNYRNQIEDEKRGLRLESGQKSGHLSEECKDKSTPEIEIELEIEKELDIEIENRYIYTASETDAEPPTPTSRPDKPSAKRFVKPTLEEVEAYCIERNNSIDPQRFIDYYESNGWKVGKNPMKDWKATIRTWERSEYNDNGGAKNAKHSGNSKAAEPQPSRKLGTYI